MKREDGFKLCGLTVLQKQRAARPRAPATTQRAPRLTSPLSLSFSASASDSKKKRKLFFFLIRRSREESKSKDKGKELGEVIGATRVAIHADRTVIKVPEQVFAMSRTLDPSIHGRLRD